MLPYASFLILKLMAYTISPCRMLQESGARWRGSENSEKVFFSFMFVISICSVTCMVLPAHWMAMELHDNGLRQCLYDCVCTCDYS